MNMLLLSCLAFVLLAGVAQGNSNDTAAAGNDTAVPGNDTDATGGDPIDKIVHIYFASKSEELMKKFATEDGSVPKDKRKQAVDELTKMTKESQREVIQAIEGHPKKYEYESFWVVNMIIMNETDSDLLEKITDMKNVRSVDLYDRPPPFPPEEVMGASEAASSRADDAQWNIKQLNVPEVWKTGINGSGVVIATLHNGAFTGHAFIRHNFRGDDSTKGYGFYEPRVTACAHPHDRSHTTTLRVGLAAANNGYGVAPGAIYMLCSVDVTNANANFMGCVEWTICPHNGGTVIGNDIDCTKAPAAVSISSVLHGNAQIPPRDVIDSVNMLVAMGITVITDAGRIDGNPCRRISTACAVPSSICVGFTNQDGKRSKFSACGPGPGNITKPDLVVPGYMVQGPGSCENVCPPRPAQSCLYTDDGTTSGSGHVLGVVALMVQKNPRLSPARIKQILLDSSKMVEDEEFQCCGDLEQRDRPNYCAGYGLLDAKKAVDSS